MFSIFWPFRLLGFLLMLVMNLLVAAACVLTVTSFLGEKGWLWDLSSHFRMHYLVIQMIALVISLVMLKLRRKSRLQVLSTFIFMMFFIGLNLTQIAPYYLPSPKPDESRLRARIKLLHVNVLNVSRNADPVIELIRKTDPDILSIEEYNDWWKGTIKRSGVLQRFPYKQVVSFGDNGFYSKIPIEGVKVDYRQEGGVDPTIIIRMRANGEPFTVVQVHPRPPLRPEWISRSQQHYDAWIRERPSYGSNLILMGDLNRTQWSELFRKLMYQTRLRDSQLGFGVQPTWPSIIPPATGTIKAEKPWFARWMGIPIDHFLVSDNFVVLKRKTGPFVGSDHLPVYIELGLKQ